MGLLHQLQQHPVCRSHFFLHHVKDQRGIAAFVALMCAVGAVLLYASARDHLDSAGFGSGATMILGLTFIGLRASSAHQVAALSGMAQSVGYLLAACGPPLMGKIHDANGNWSVPLDGCCNTFTTDGDFDFAPGETKKFANIRCYSDVTNHA